MEKLDMTSPDLTAANVAKIAELFPTVVTERLICDERFPHEHAQECFTRGINFDMLRQELSDHVVEGPQERYQLDWPGKREALFAANAPIAKTLRPVREESVDFDTTKNLFIEGDNLEALKLLQESYLGKVKLIYIDPPYNTGNDFIYDDDFAETREEYLARSGQVDESGAKLVANTEANGRFHSDWLSMMYPRLKLARNLLAENGLIFVSADDSELAGLVQVLAELFGRSNVIASVAWEKRYTRSNNANSFYSVKDSLVLCCRSGAAASIKEVRPDGASDIYSNPDSDPRGPWTSSSYVNPATKAARPNLSYPLVRPADSAEITHPTHAWKFSRVENDRHSRENRLWWGKDGLAQYPRLKVFLAELGEGMVPVDLWSHEDAGTTDAGGAELKGLFDGAAVFDFPKPTRLLKKILGIYVPPWKEWSRDFVVLDFFAGSSSTAHAVIAQNAADSQNRRFIMVELPERIAPKSTAAQQGYSNVAELSRERIRRAGKKISEEAGLTAGDLDVGFRTLRVDSTNMADVLRTPDAVDQGQLDGFTDSVKAGRTGEDLLFQVLLDWGLTLDLPIERETIDGREVFTVDGGALIACFDADVSLDVVRTIAQREPLRAVFRDSGFVSDADRINAEQVFAEVSPATDVKAI